MLWKLLLALSCALYAAVLGAGCLARHARPGSTSFDLGIFDQAIWLISQGQTPFVTVRGLHVMGDHFQPVVYLLAPLYRIWPDVTALLLLQVVALASGALPLFLYARRRLGSPAAAYLVSLAYLLYPGLHCQTMFDFHPVALATPLLLWALWLAESGRWGGFYGCLILALTCKHTVGLALVVWGLVLVRSGRPVQGFLTLVLGLGGFGAGMAALRWVNGGQDTGHWALYAHLGGSPQAVLGQVLAHPWQTLGQLTTLDRLLYLLKVLGPLAFLPLLCPLRLAPALPQILLNVLSWKSSIYSGINHYEATVIPFLFAAATGGLEVLARRAPRLLVAAPAGALAVAACLAGLAIYPGSNLERLWVWPTPARAAALRQMLERIPPEASVSADTHLVPHLAHRRQIYLFPNPFVPVCYGNGAEAVLQQRGGLGLQPSLVPGLRARKIDFIALGPLDEEQWPLGGWAAAKALYEVLREEGYGVVTAGEGLILFQRGAPHREGLALLRRSPDMAWVALLAGLRLPGWEPPPLGLQEPRPERRPGR